MFHHQFSHKIEPHVVGRFLLHSSRHREAMKQQFSCLSTLFIEENEETKVIVAKFKSRDQVRQCWPEGSVQISQVVLEMLASCVWHLAIPTSG